MDTLKDAVFVLSIIAVFVLIYFLISRLDGYLDAGRRASHLTEEKHLPDSVVLTDRLTDEEILKEIRKFRTEHDGVLVVLYDPDDPSSVRFRDDNVE